MKKDRCVPEDEIGAWGADSTACTNIEYKGNKCYKNNELERRCVSNHLWHYSCTLSSKCGIYE